MTTLRLDPFQDSGKKGDHQRRDLGPVWYVDPEKADLDIDIEKVVLDIVRNTKKLRDLDITEIITEGEIEETMEGSSNVTITLHDPDGELLNSGALERAVDVMMGGLWFRLVAIRKEGSYLTLTFEDRVVSYLKSHNKILHMSRGKMNRLEFCLYVIRQIRKGQVLTYDDYTVSYPAIACVIPELTKPMKFEQLSRADKTSLEVSRKRNRNQGLPDESFLIYHADGSSSQSTKGQNRIMEDALDAGVSMEGMNVKVLVAAIATMMIETGVRNMSQAKSDLDSQGPFQQRPGQGWPNSRNTKVQARAFYRAALEIYKDDHSITAGELAASVQRPKASLRDRYAHAVKYAQRVVDAYSGEPITQRTYRQKYTFTTADSRKKKQNYWDALGMLTQEVQYARFMSNGYLYIVSEVQLFKSKSRMTLTPLSPGVNSLEFNWDTGNDDASATIECRIARWVAPPGTVITLHDCGPASGRWLVSSIRRNLYGRDATITLKKPQPLLPEPAGEIASVSVDETTAAGFSPGLGLPKKVAAMYRMAKRISDKHYPYVWGGGHARAGTPDRGTGRDPGIGYDCSGSTAAVLVAGGYYTKGQSVPVSNEVPGAAGMARGEGAYFTVWANGTHVFIEFYRDGKHDTKHTIHFGTGNWGKGWGGAGINQNLHPKAGFLPYHLRDEPSRVEFEREKKKKGKNDGSGQNTGRDVKNTPVGVEAPPKTGVFADPTLTPPSVR